MHWPFADTFDRHPHLRRVREVLAFADARARDVRMGQVAGSLTFTTILSVVPLFAVALALFTACASRPSPLHRPGSYGPIGFPTPLCARTTRRSVA